MVIGGDGSIRAAMRLVSAITRRGLDIAVVAIPKTIDNDLPYTDQSFGFQSAFERATDFIDSVAVEAAAHEHGVGIVKLMGRHSGFIACYATLANYAADMVLIPEIPFTLEGAEGLLARVEHHVLTRGHVVIVVAEGAGQDLLAAAGRLDRDGATDASGNLKLGDIGQFVAEEVTGHLSRVGLTPTLRYIDPSYSIRSVTANAYDSVYCLRLAHAAVHAAMAGRTETVVVRWRRRFVHVPMPLITSHRNQVDPDGDLWMSVLEATDQPEALAGQCEPGVDDSNVTETPGVDPREQHRSQRSFRPGHESSTRSPPCSRVTVPDDWSDPRHTGGRHRPDARRGRRPALRERSPGDRDVAGATGLRTVPARHAPRPERPRIGRS